MSQATLHSVYIAIVLASFWDNRDFFFYEGMQLEICPTQFDYSQTQEFIDATEKFRGQARIGPDDSMENYIAGPMWIA